MTTDLRKADLTTVTIVTDDPNSLITIAFHNETWPTDKMFEQKQVTVNNPLLFQICMIENISRSKLNQTDELQILIDPRKQKVDRLSTSRDRQQLISEVNVDEDNNNEMGTDSSIDPGSNHSTKDVGNLNQHIYKLTLQDRKGNLFFAINLDSVPGLKTCLLGSKIIILPGSQFSRGMFSFTNNTVKLMYGLISQWNEDKFCLLYTSRCV